MPRPAVVVISLIALAVTFLIGLAAGLAMGDLASTERRYDRERERAERLLDADPAADELFPTKDARTGAVSLRGRVATTAAYDRIRGVLDRLMIEEARAADRVEILERSHAAISTFAPPPEPTP